jgi:hypothetical protein
MTIRGSRIRGWEISFQGIDKFLEEKWSKSAIARESA